MRHISSDFRIRNFILFILFVSFSSTCLATEQQKRPIQTKQYFIEEAVFIYNVKKLVEKLNKTEGKSSKKTLKALVKLKIEIENYIGSALNMDYFFDEVVKEAREREKGRKRASWNSCLRYNINRCWVFPKMDTNSHLSNMRGQSFYGWIFILDWLFLLRRW